MDLLAKAREFGHAIQQDDTYKAMFIANEACDKSEDLQKKIESFNVLREELNKEIMKETKDTEKLADMDVKIKAEYEVIMQIPAMIGFNEAKVNFSKKMAFVNHIINESANGAKPDEVEMDDDGCGGSCSSCSGCH